MRKTIAFLAVAAAALTSTIGMARTTEGEQRFVRDGQTYVYTARTGDSMRVIDGRAYPSGGRFHLVVRGDRVSGTSNGTPVSFRLADVRTGGLETAAR